MNKTVTIISRSFSDVETMSIITNIQGKIEQVKNLIILQGYKSSCINDMDDGLTVKILSEYSVYGRIEFQHMINEAVGCNTDYVVIINNEVRFAADSFLNILKEFDSQDANIFVSDGSVENLGLCNSCFLDGNKFVVLKKPILKKLNGVYFASLMNFVFTCTILLKEPALSFRTGDVRFFTSPFISVNHLIKAVANVTDKKNIVFYNRFEKKSFSNGDHYLDYYGMAYCNRDLVSYHDWDINATWPFQDNSLVLLNLGRHASASFDICHTLNEAYRCLALGGCLVVKPYLIENNNGYDLMSNSCWTDETFLYASKGHVFNQYVSNVMNCNFKVCARNPYILLKE